jgi:hypothetical protein
MVILPKNPRPHFTAEPVAKNAKTFTDKLFRAVLRIVRNIRRIEEKHSKDGYGTADGSIR